MAGAGVGVGSAAKESGSDTGIVGTRPGSLGAVVVGVVIVVMVGVVGRTVPEAGREAPPDRGRGRWTPDAGRDDALLLISDTGLDEDRERPDARHDTAGEGGAGRDEVRDVTDWMLSL